MFIIIANVYCQIIESEGEKENTEGGGKKGVLEVLMGC